MARKKRNMEDLRYYRLHDDDRPLGEREVFIRFQTLEELQYHYEYVMKKSEVVGLFIIEEQENDKSNPGKLTKIFYLARDFK
jgi:hypothetical protein